MDNRIDSVPGLKRNWRQFALLVLINAFVGGMVGLERTILPEIAETDFGIAARSAIFSFIVVFGITKAIANYFAGRFAQSFGRKKMLITGWLFGMPVPFMLMLAPDWNWIIAANVLLGINQGLAWSANVIMKIDLAGEKDRGLAMGLNEFSGYLAVAIVAFLTGFIASEFGLRPYPFYLGIGLSVMGLLMSIFLVRDTASFVKYEAGKSDMTRVKKNLFYEVSLSVETNHGSVENLSKALETDFVSNVYNLEKASKFRLMADAFEGGRAIFNYPTGYVKCGGAPQKITWLSEDLWRSKGNGLREQADVNFFTPHHTVFPAVPKVDDAVRPLYDD